ncbi:MAG: SusC/RagA family TonB-linked outer membrane protein [Prevotella sp.]
MRFVKSLQKPLVLVFLFCLLPLGAWAQNIVKGTVNDESGSPVIGATIKVAGTNEGALSDISGAFAVKADRNATLSISYIGYVTQKVSVNGRTDIVVVLKEDNTTLSDVVVIGYGTAKRSDISGSVASVDADKMLKKTPVNLADGLKGAAPGVLVTSQDGAPDALAQVRIRGVGTINGNSEPLYVVDGVQVGTDANFLNPQDIESIEVLKDASATAIYGSRGANGVVMITTKHGSKGVTHVDVSANWGIQTLQRKFDTLDNPDDYAALIRAGRAASGQNIVMPIWDSKYDGQRNYVDWQDVMTRTTLRENYNVSASGGTDKFQGNFSAGYLKNDGIVVNTRYERMNLRGTFKSKVNKYLEFGGDVNYTHSVSRGSNRGIGNNGNLSSLRDYATMSPTMDYTDSNGNVIHNNVVNSDGTYGTFFQTTTQGSETASQDSYYAVQMELDNPTRTNRVLANAFVDINPIKGLHLKSIFSWDKAQTQTSSWATPEHRYDANGNEITMVGTDTRREFNLSQSVNYTRQWESYITYNWSDDNHDVNVMLGNSVSNSYGSWVSAGAKDFPAETIRDLGLTSNLDTRDGNGAFNAETRFISYFGRLMYSFKDRYNLTATVRRDGSSNFGAGNRWGTFPSAAASWRISEEPFMKDVTAVSNLKLRLGWGRTGNAGSATSLAVAQMSSASNLYYFYAPGATTQSHITANGIAASRVVDTNLKWETNEQWNVGLDFSILNGNINVALDYFVRNSKDLLLYQSMRPSTGFADVYTNYGEVRNKGFEFSINYNKRLNKDWTIGATFTGSTLSNKIIKSGADIFSECSGGNDGTNIDGSNVQAVNAAGYKWEDHSICREGYAVGSYWGYRTDGIFRSQAEIDALNATAREKGYTAYQDESTAPGDIKFVDLNGDGTINGKDMDVIGNGFPKFNFGLTLNASYKNWDFSVYTYGVLGQDILSYSAMRLETILTDGDQTPNILKEAFANSYTNNPNGNVPRLNIIDRNYNTRCSDWWVKNGDFWKINNIQIGYTFPKSLIAPLMITSARLSFSISNLACISGYNKYGDPECGQGSVLFTGLDTGRYPTPRTYSFGLSVQF